MAPGRPTIQPPGLTTHAMCQGVEWLDRRWGDRGSVSEAAPGVGHHDVADRLAPNVLTRRVAGIPPPQWGVSPVRASLSP